MENPNSSKKMMSFFDSIFKGDKKIKIIVVIGIIGIVCIFFSQILEPKKTSKNSVSSQQTVTAEDYTHQLEQRLLSLVKNIDGVGEAQVMVTLQSGVEYVYAGEEKKNTDKKEDVGNDDTKRLQEQENYEQKIIVVDGSNGKEALLKTQIEPKVKGVVVVCSGGENPVVEQRIIDAITTALDIDSNEVCVTKLS